MWKLLSSISAFGFTTGLPGNAGSNARTEYGANTGEKIFSYEDCYLLDFPP